MSIKTNGQVLAERGRNLGDALADTARYAAAHPDEVLIAVAPVVILAAATARHRLTRAEDLTVGAAGYFLGLSAWAAWKRWKQSPAPGAPRLRKVA